MTQYAEVYKPIHLSYFEYDPEVEELWEDEVRRRRRPAHRTRRARPVPRVRRVRMGQPHVARARRRQPVSLSGWRRRRIPRPPGGPRIRPRPRPPGWPLWRPWPPRPYPPQVVVDVRPPYPVWPAEPAVPPEPQAQPPPEAPPGGPGGAAGPLAEPVEQGSEFVRWLQSTLNMILKLRLPVNGIMDPATRSAIRDFQRRERLPEDGIAGPETKSALTAARRRFSGQETPSAGPQPPPGAVKEELAPGPAWEYFIRPQGKVDRGSRDYIRWVQEALNKVLGIRLASDGLMGPATRSAVRSFQARSGLVIDGIVGPKTETALQAALQSGPSGPGQPGKIGPCPKLPLRFVVDGYNRDQKTAGPAQQKQLAKIVAALLRSFGPGCAAPERIVIVGHASTEGPADYNRRLGRQRAEDIQRYLESSSALILALMKKPTAFVIRSEGEGKPLVRERSEADRKRNRRVEVILLPSEGSGCGAPTRSHEVAFDSEMMRYETGSRPTTTVKPRLCLFQNYSDSRQRNHFQCGALRQARRIAAIGSPDSGNCRRRVGATSYDSGADIIRAINNAHTCLGDRAVEIVHIFSHGFSLGIPGTTLGSAGLYVNGYPLVDRAEGGRTVADLPTAPLANNVVFVLHGCNMAAKTDNIARALYQHLASSLSNPKVYGHYNAGCASRNNSWREYSNSYPAGRNAAPRAYYSDVGCCS